MKALTIGLIDLSGVRFPRYGSRDPTGDGFTQLAILPSVSSGAILASGFFHVLRSCWTCYFAFQFSLLSISFLFWVGLVVVKPERNVLVG